MTENKHTEGYYIFDLERGQFWNKNKQGYTSEINQAGLYDYESALSILKDANLVELNTIIFHNSEKNDYLFGDKRSELNQKARSKRDLNELLSELSSVYHPTNPLSIVEKTLFKEGYYFQDDNIIDAHVEYEKTKKIKIDINSPREGESIMLSIYRMPSGNYELTAYAVNEPKSKNKNKKRI